MATKEERTQLVERRIAEHERDVDIMRMVAKVRLLTADATLSEHAVRSVARISADFAAHSDTLNALLAKYGRNEPAHVMLELVTMRNLLDTALRTCLVAANGKPDWMHTDLDVQELVFGEPDSTSILAYCLNPAKGTDEMLPSYAANLAKATPDDFSSFCAGVKHGVISGAGEISLRVKYLGAKDPAPWRDAWILTAKAVAATTGRKPSGKATDEGKTLTMTIPLPAPSKRSLAPPDGEMLEDIEERLGMQHKEGGDV